jgi:hypothetical protein
VLQYRVRGHAVEARVAKRQDLTHPEQIGRVVGHDLEVDDVVVVRGLLARSRVEHESSRMAFDERSLAWSVVSGGDGVDRDDAEGLAQLFRQEVEVGLGALTGEVGAEQRLESRMRRPSPRRRSWKCAQPDRIGDRAFKLRFRSTPKYGRHVKYPYGCPAAGRFNPLRAFGTLGNIKRGPSHHSPSLRA